MHIIYIIYIYIYKHTYIEIHVCAHNNSSSTVVKGHLISLSVPWTASSAALYSDLAASATAPIETFNRKPQASSAPIIWSVSGLYSYSSVVRSTGTCTSYDAPSVCHGTKNQTADNRSTHVWSGNTFRL